MKKPIALTTLILMCLAAWPVHGDSDLDAGHTIFRKNCMGCHGTGGKGDGPAAFSMDPKPANFTDTKLLHQKSDKELEDIVRNGFPNSGMLGWKAKLNDTQIHQVVMYVRTFAP